MSNLDSEEQSAIRQSVRKLCKREIKKFQTQTYYNTVPRELFKMLADLGVTGLVIAEEHGGLGQNAPTSAVVMEELAYFDLGPAIFISVHNMVAGLIQKFGSPYLQNRFLPGMANGSFLGAFALTEPGAGSDAAALKTTAIKDGDSYILHGNKCFITSAGFADLYLLFARNQSANDEISAFIVEKDTKGLEICEPEKKMGCELSPIASIYLKEMRVSEKNLLGDAEQGFKIALAGLNGGRINIAACANGISRSAIDYAIAHLKEREQFGQKLAEFQALQFILADMQISLDAATALTWQAAKQQADGAKEAKRAASAAKSFASDSAMRITTDAVQLLGGSGYVKDYQVERLMRDAKMLQIVEGTNQIQRVIIAREMLQ